MLVCKFAHIARNAAANRCRQNLFWHNSIENSIRFVRFVSVQHSAFMTHIHFKDTIAMDCASNIEIMIFIFVFICSTDGTESPILADPEAEGRSDKPKFKYGELVILG